MHVITNELTDNADILKRRSDILGSLRKIWGLPFNSHCYLLPLLSQCSPLLDEICRHSLNLLKCAFVTVCR